MKSECCFEEMDDSKFCPKCGEACEGMRSDEEIKKIPFGKLNPSELARAAEIVNQIDNDPTGELQEEFCN